MRNAHSPYAAPVALAVSLCLTSIALAATLWTGRLTADNPVFNRLAAPIDGTLGGPCGGLSGIGTAVHYQSLPFVVFTDGEYTLTSTTPTGLDGVIFIYSPSFNPASPTLNCHLAGDDGPGGPGVDSQIVAALTAGTPYVLVQASYSNGETGDFVVSATGPGGIARFTYLPMVLR